MNLKALMLKVRSVMLEKGLLIKVFGRTVLILLIFAVILATGSAFGSWLIDPAKFHMSAHGQISCQECHEDISSMKLHPDPELVGKRRLAFFDPQHCLVCHDEVEEDLDNGVHGRKRISNKKKYGYCIRCHKPHYQMRVGEDRIGHFKEGIPREKQCSACHEMREKLPSFEEDDRACISCHIKSDLLHSQGREAAQHLCLHCHGKGMGEASHITAKTLGLIDLSQYRHTVHSALTCIECHKSAAAFGHADQKSVECLSCHVRHDEKKAHDAHLTVSCGACHVNSIEPFRDETSKEIRFKVVRESSGLLKVHEMPRHLDTESCKKCHFKNNDLGAPALVLPAKSIMCMGCHASTFSIGDTTTIIALALFVIGVLLFLSYSLSGSIPGRDGNTNSITKFFILLGMGLKGLFSRRFPYILKAMVLDVLLQRRLYRRSEARWWIHALIFYPFLFRFTWGVIGLLGSLLNPSSNWVWSLLDKNNMVTAFCFDLSGILLLLGIVLALCRELLSRLRRPISLPEQDPWALFFIVGIVVAGFVLEGMRMAMTGLPGNAEYALVGYWISSLFTGMKGLSSFYVYVWYVHAILVGGFIAYIPFSRLFHIIMAPITLAMSAGGEGR
ncbi:MAG: respiratory nitrate reductase subunit gamma [Deltaproteobacteria bacterium]|nr:respiratory nitrate reductase subunit gamma [Deltaproteobacteria bacterium]MBW2126908.1 respiratory nitrate reductase subunit gamma [Deltaproteobacteria bacterium]